MGSIRAEGIEKVYRSYARPADRLLDWLTFGRGKRARTRHALRGVGLEVRPGEAVGLVGPNGAGKSTLLGILRGTIRPTRGSVTIEGRVAGLDLGLGFRDDVTGYDNLVASGALLGLDRRAVDAAIGDILDFAELEDVLGDPVRTYSSGMRLRLAFALATVERPEVLLIDEALAVGDAYFQQKCIHRIRTFQAAGTTLLLVSHDPAAVTTLCDRALLLDDGLVIREGRPREVLEYYNAWLARRTDQDAIEQATGASGGPGSTRSGNRSATIERVSLSCEGAERDQIVVGETVEIRIEAVAHQALEDLTVGISVRDRLGNEVFGTNTWLLGVAPPEIAAETPFIARFRLGAELGPGTYSLTAALHAGRVHVVNSYDWWDNVAAFTVLPDGTATFQGAARLPVEASIESRADDTDTSASPVGHASATGPDAGDPCPDAR